MTEVYLNGKFVGDVENKDEFLERIKSDRRSGVMDSSINFYYDNKLDQVFIETLRGRTRRPLIVVKDGIPLLTEKHIKQLQKRSYLERSC